MSKEERRWGAKRRWFKRRWFILTVGIVTGTVLILFGIFEYVLKTAQPTLRARVIESLSKRFQSPVELDDFRVSLIQGMEVSGSGLRILTVSPADPASPALKQPMLSVRHFRFHLKLQDLFRHNVYLPTVYVQGVRLDLPPNRRVNAIIASKKHGYDLFADEIICSDTVLVLETSKPGKVPLEFDIARITLHDVGPNKPFAYEATLVNPKPVGDIHATGNLGPWKADDPRNTPLSGDYSFRNANLATTAGIAGTLSSDGHFSGPLQELTVDGEADVPDFSLDIASHPVPLHTWFHATVDGTSGDTTLNPVHARLLHSEFTAAGTIKLVRENGSGIGHDIDLNVVMDNARIEDMLQLAVHTEPPLMRGKLSTRAHLHLPPGKQTVLRKLDLQGNFMVRSAFFSNPNFQNKVDSMSMRAQGEAKKANAKDADVVASTMSGHFVLDNAAMDISNLKYQLPGALVQLNGVYSLDGNTFDFHGDVLTDATISQMTTGWKSFLLKPVNPFFKKDGGGAKIPIKITGTKSDPHFGLDLGHKDEKKEDKQKQDKEDKQQKKQAAKSDSATKH